MSEASTPRSPPNGPHRLGNGTDPSRNVLDLVDAAIQRQDDLREAESRHVREIAKLRAEYQAELRLTEAERINAIRAVDVAASLAAAKDAEVRAQALAKQVSDTAEANRNQVAAAATAAATSLGAALVPIQERLSELTRLQYEQQGQKAQVIESRADVVETRETKGASQNTILFVVAVIVAAGSFYFGSRQPEPVVVTPTPAAAVPSAL